MNAARLRPVNSIVGHLLVMVKPKSSLIIILAYFLFVHAGVAQEKSQIMASEFLKRQGILQKYDARIENESVVMPKRLSDTLLYAFPKHRFTHIRIEASVHSIVSIPADFIVVSDASGQPIGFLSSTYRIASVSFKDILTAYQSSSTEDALNRVLILGQLVAYPKDDRVGRVFWSGNRISAEVISTFEPYLILRVDVDARLKFGRVHFFNVKKHADGWNA